MTKVLPGSVYLGLIAVMAATAAEVEPESSHGSGSELQWPPYLPPPAKVQAGDHKEKHRPTDPT